MKTVIIADDLTGANDTGIHLASGGVRTVVKLDTDVTSLNEYDAVVFDTDSRSDSPEEAYRKVKLLCERIRPHEPHIVYKKIDSTLRGNIGAEIDAVYDTLQPDLVVIAPAYPRLGRIVRGGMVYVDGVPLHTTQTANDLKTPVYDSYMPGLLQLQSTRKTAIVDAETLSQETEAVVSRIREALRGGASYLVFDAETEEHMVRIANAVQTSALKAVWCGSAGLAHVMFNKETGIREKFRLNEQGRILISVGSVSEKTREQISRVIQDKEAFGIALRGDRLLNPKAGKKEKDDALRQAMEAFRQGRKVVMYLSGNPEDILRTHQEGVRLGLQRKEISNRLITILGTMTATLVRQAEVRHLIMMGGDTARQVCLELGANGLELIEEVEGGAPLMRLLEGKCVYAITKSGGFGDEYILQRMIRYYEGGEMI